MRIWRGLFPLAVFLLPALLCAENSTNPYAPPGTGLAEPILDWLGTLERLSPSELAPESLAAQAAEIVASLEDPERQIQNADAFRLRKLHPLAAAPVLAAASLETLRSFRESIPAGEEGSNWSRLANVAEQAKTMMEMRAIKLGKVGIALHVFQLALLASGVAGLNALGRNVSEPTTLVAAAAGLLAALVATNYGSRLVVSLSNQRKRARLKALDIQSKEALEFAVKHGLRYYLSTEIETLFYCARELSKLAP